MRPLILNNLYSRISNYRRPLFLKNYRVQAKYFEKKLKPAYLRYIQNVSSVDMAISLETSIFLSILLSWFKPKSILDLGSGFSSYVFRLAGIENPDCKIVSVDDNDSWLKETSAFLQVNKLDPGHIMSWKDFLHKNRANFDCIFHDLGNMETRKKTLSKILKLANRNSYVILDDVHSKPYSRLIKNEIRHYDCCYLSCRNLTLDGFGRYAGLILF